MAKVVLVGSPNVGKSVIFNYLTGQYVAVSNYPGTTVDVSSGYCKINGRMYEIIDTPGMYSFITITDEERVARSILLQEKPEIVVHVMDAKNIRRMLNLTIQLLDMGFPVIVVVNLMDEAEKNGIVLDIGHLSRILGIPVIPASAINGIGLEILKKEIGQYRPVQSCFHMKFTNTIEQSIMLISNQLKEGYGISPRMVALLLIQGDKVFYELASGREPLFCEMITEIKKLGDCYQYGMEYVITIERQKIVDSICDKVLKERGIYQQGTGEKLGRLTREPATGLPILCLVLFFGIYQFVGRFGAGFLVDYIDNSIFVPYINPLVQLFVYQSIPWEWMQSLVVGKYGLFTLGFRYAFIIILPIVSTFFFVFAILEDSGYLPRLAMLMDIIFKKLSLNGRAVIPFALGLGCGTMAVMVTRER